MTSFKGPVRAGVSLHATTGIRSQNDKDGYRKAFVAEAKYAQADVGRVRATVGLSATTGVNASADGVGVQVLGTGIQIGRETKISFFGSTFGVRWY
uniref:Autotransporter domain-containing protein n=1 Tax=Panagrolaimus sp. ES5 TaxID=591445 RepID=A0AC34FSF1_9BILA